MGDFIFNVKGLTAQDRAQWEKDNLEELNKLGYSTWDDTRKDRYFKNSSFKNKFGNRPDYDALKGMPQERRDSLYLASPDENVEDLQMYQSTLQSSQESINESRANDGKLIGEAGRQWRDFDKILDEVSPYYKRFKGTEYFPIDADKQVDLMSTYEAETQAFGESIAMQKMADRIKSEVSENQPLLDKVYNGIAGAGANIVGGLISFVGNIVGGATALTGLDRVFDENQKEGYLDNLWAQFIDNSWTRYGNKIMSQGTMFTSDDPEEAYDRLEIIRTAEEDSNLIDNIFSVNTIPELVKNSGFTVASMIEGYGLSSVGNYLFNSAKAATLGSKLAQTTDKLNQVNRHLQSLNTMQRRYNAYAVPALVGQGEGAINALNTKIDYLEDAKRMIAQKQEQAVNEEVEKRLQGITIPEDVVRDGKEDAFIESARQSIKNTVWEEYQPMYEDAVRRAEVNADKAALTNFAINSFINGAANITLKASMFGGKTTEALNRSKVGKLFTSNKYSLDDAGNVVANEISKGRMAWNMAKESLGEGLEEYGQDISDAFSRGAAENDLVNYMEQRYNGIADDAIVDSLTSNLGAAFAAAGERAISKEAIQSGIYGALGQLIGTPNVNAILSKSDRVSLEGKSTLGKVGATIRNIYRNPFVESFMNDKQENQNRRESAKVLNEWLNQGNNKERITTLAGSLGWAKSMQDAADNGDEFSYRNSRLGKQIQDYYMLEQLKETPLYDAYMQRYMDILNAQEGDEMAEQIAQYDSRPLEDIKKDAQNMLDVMQQVQEATADIEKTLGNSIPKEAKEALIYGKISMNDWRDRATKLEEELQTSYGGGTSSTLSDAQKQYISENGVISEPTKYLKEIERVQSKIANLEKNKAILSDNQKKEKIALEKQLKELQNRRKKEVSTYEALAKGMDENPILTEADIMNLSPVARYKMLNPENKNKYSKEQQEVITRLIEKGTAYTSDFMNKIEDAARINDAQTIFLKRYNEALKNPNILVNIDNRLRLEKKIENAEKSYNKLNGIEDYAAFAEAVDNAFLEADDIEAVTIDRTLSKNPLYQRYKKDDEVMEGIYNQLLKNDALANISEEDKDLVAAMTKFLSRKGIDISNYDAAISALTSSDESGQSNLTKYIEAINQKSDTKISLNNIGSVVNAYKRALESYKKNEEVKEEVTRKAEEKPIGVEKPTPLTGIFASADAELSTPEEVKKKAEEARKQGTVQVTEMETPEGENTTALSDSFINNNSPEVTSTAEKAISIVRNASSIYDEESKKAAIDAINSLGENSYGTAEDLQYAIASKASEMLNAATKGGDLNERVGSLLQQASHNSRAEKEEKKEEKPNTNTTTSPKSISLARINSNLTGFLSQRFKEWKVDDYLRSGKLNRKTGTRTKVYYAAIDNVTQGVKEDMSKGSTAYNDEHYLPILALVEDSEGPIILGNTRYQPIGVLPRTELDSRAGQIRQLAINQPNSIISYGNRKLISSVEVASPPLNISTSKETDKDFTTLIYEDLSTEDREIIEDSTQDPIKKRVAYDKYVDKVASRLKAHKDKAGKPTLFYTLPTMKGDKSVTEIPVLTKALDETTSTLTGESLESVLKTGDSSAIINFNSRTKGFAREISNLVQRNDLTELTSDGENFTGESKALTAINGINTILRRYIYSANSDYSIRPAFVGDGLGLDLYIGEENIGRIVDSISDKEVYAENLANILKNLMMPNSFREGINWQVDKDPSYYTPNTKHYRKENVTNLIYDNILRVGIDRLERTISEVRVSNPVALKEPVPSNPSTSPTNADNATSTNTQSVGESNTQSGEKVNTDTGLSNSGQEVKNEITTAMEVAQEISNKIEEDSKEIQLSEDGKTYVNTITGKSYARVTSIIQADEHAGERFDANSPWVTPSTNIGTGIDEFVRDFFAGKLDDPKLILSDLYPNATQGQLNIFRGQLQKLKNYLDAQGLTVIPRDVVATGNMQVTDSTGKTHTIAVAGTLDLLAYDREGNFYIFDMKTHRAASISDEKMSKYSKQLSMYKNFLESKYNIKVKSLNIIPIHVEYPAPNSSNTYTVSSKNQLLLNGKEYKMSNPTLGEVTQISESAISIQYDKLTDSEKALIEISAPTTNEIKEAKIEPEIKERKEGELTIGKVKTKRKPIARKTDTKPIKVSTNPTGISFNDLTEGQKEALRTKYNDVIDIEDFFNSWTEIEKQHELDCLG